MIGHESLTTSLSVPVVQVFHESNITISYFAEFGRLSSDDFVRSVLLKTIELGRSEINTTLGGFSVCVGMLLLWILRYPAGNLWGANSSC